MNVINFIVRFLGAMAMAVCAVLLTAPSASAQPCPDVEVSAVT
jgi:hypothetical protein